MATSSARLVIAGLSGDSGKTIASLSILAGLRRRGMTVSVFKKGPDYIDPAWLSLVGQFRCRSLDTYMVAPDAVFRNFIEHADGTDISVVEGNRGMFDGKDAAGSHSTAELAKLIDAPIVLVVNASKQTRTVAAIVKGCLDFDPDVYVAGVILNRVAGSRHLRMLSESIGRYSGLPVLGAIPKLGDDSSLIPGRHLGLVPPAEHEACGELQEKLNDIADDYLDMDSLISAARSANLFSRETMPSPRKKQDGVTIGYFNDSVFTFYYPENLEALESQGATLVAISSLSDTHLQEVDALYIGGGFPETHAEQLSGNRSLMESVSARAQEGLPVYAECGGLIYLSRSLASDGHVYPMSGLFPVDLQLQARPVGHGYTTVQVDTGNPFYAVGTTIRGHEFHYSGPTSGRVDGVTCCMNVESGVGVGGGRDGLVCANTLACYTHVHADGVTTWAESLVSKAREYANGRPGRGSGSDDGGGERPESRVH